MQQPYYECPQSYGQHASLGAMRGSTMVYLSFSGLTLTPSPIAFVAAPDGGFYIQDVTAQQYIKNGSNPNVAEWTADSAQAAIFKTRCGTAPGSTRFLSSNDNFLQFSSLNTVAFGNGTDFFVDYGSVPIPTDWPPKPVWPLEWLCQPPEPGQNVSLAFYRNSASYSTMTGDCVDPANTSTRKPCSDPTSICWDNSRTAEQNARDYIRCGDKNECRFKCGPGFTGCGTCVAEPDMLKLHYFNSNSPTKVAFEPTPVAFIKNGEGFSLLDVTANTYVKHENVAPWISYTPNLADATTFQTRCGNTPGSIKLRMLIPGNTTSMVGLYCDREGVISFVSGGLTDFFINAPPAVPPAVWPPPPPLQPLLIPMGYHRLSTSNGWFYVYPTGCSASQTQFGEIQFVKVPGGFHMLTMDNKPIFGGPGTGGVLSVRSGSLPGSINIFRNENGKTEALYFYEALASSGQCSGYTPQDEIVFSTNESRKFPFINPPSEMNPFAGKPPTDWFLDALPPPICGVEISTFDRQIPVSIYAYQTGADGKALCIPEVYDGNHIDTKVEQVYVLATGESTISTITGTGHKKSYVTQFVICSTSLLKPKYYVVDPTLRGVVTQTEDYFKATRFSIWCGAGKGQVYFLSSANQYLSFNMNVFGVWNLGWQTTKAEDCLFSMGQEPKWACVDSICQAAEGGPYSTENCSYQCPYTLTPPPTGFQISTKTRNGETVSYTASIYGGVGFKPYSGSQGTNWEFVYAGQSESEYQPNEMLKNANALYFIRNVSFPEYYLSGTGAAVYSTRAVTMQLTRYQLHAGLFIVYTDQSPSEYAAKITLRYMGTYQNRTQQSIEYIVGSFYIEPKTQLLIAAPADDVYGSSPDAAFYTTWNFNPNLIINPPLQHLAQNVFDYNTTLDQSSAQSGVSAIMAKWDIVDFRDSAKVITDVTIASECPVGWVNVGASGKYLPADATPVEAQWVRTRSVCTTSGAAKNAQKNVIDMSLGIKKGLLCAGEGASSAKEVQNCNGVPMTRAGDYALGYDDSNNMSLYAGYSTALLSPEPRL